MVFPKTQNPPVLLPKLLRNSEVALLVPPQFGNPVVPVAPGLAPMRRAPMPETAVDEHSKAGVAENEIRAAG